MIIVHVRLHLPVSERTFRRLAYWGRTPEKRILILCSKRIILYKIQIGGPQQCKIASPNINRFYARVSRRKIVEYLDGSNGRMDDDLTMVQSGVIVDAPLLRQQKCIDDTTFAVQIASILLDYKFI